MFTFLSRLAGSFGRLADSLDSLTATTAEVNARLRSQLRLDDQPDDGRRVIDHRPDDAEADHKPARNGRAKATA